MPLSPLRVSADQPPCCWNGLSLGGFAVDTLVWLDILSNNEKATVLKNLQGHVIVEPNLLIFKLLAGYGYLFFGYALT